jgi:hypothetical protein
VVTHGVLSSTANKAPPERGARPHDEISVTITIGEKLRASIADDGVGDADPSAAPA